MAKDPKVDKDTAKIIRELRRQGFEVDYSTKGHPQVYRDGKRIATFSGSASDHRSMKNSLADCRREGFVWPRK